MTEAERERAIHVLRERYACGDLSGEQFEEELSSLFALETSAELREFLPADHREQVLGHPPSITASATDIDTVERHLSSGEHVEWIGKPDPTKRFSRSDVFLIPFSLMWGGFAILWETLAIAGGAPWFFGLWGIPFVALGLYLIFGRFIYKADRKRRTVYSVTNRRVLAIVRRRRGEAVEAVYLRSIPNISTNSVANGRGSVEFGLSSPMASWYANSGMEFFARGLVSTGVCFYDIQDPQGVADLVERLQAADPQR